MIIKKWLKKDLKKNLFSKLKLMQKKYKQLSNEILQYNKQYKIMLYLTYNRLNEVNMQ